MSDRDESNQDWPVKSLCHAYGRLHRKRFGIALPLIFLCGASLFLQLLFLRLWPTVLLLMLLLFLNLRIHLVHWKDRQPYTTESLRGGDLSENKSGGKFNNGNILNWIYKRSEIQADQTSLKPALVYLCTADTEASSCLKCRNINQRIIYECTMTKLLQSYYNFLLLARYNYIDWQQQAYFTSYYGDRWSLQIRYLLFPVILFKKKINGHQNQEAICSKHDFCYVMKSWKISESHYLAFRSISYFLGFVTISNIYFTPVRREAIPGLYFFIISSYRLQIICRIIWKQPKYLSTLPAVA